MFKLFVILFVLKFYARINIYNHIQISLNINFFVYCKMLQIGVTCLFFSILLLLSAKATEIQFDGLYFKLL